MKIGLDTNNFIFQCARQIDRRVDFRDKVRLICSLLQKKTQYKCRNFKNVDKFLMARLITSKVWPTIH